MLIKKLLFTLLFAAFSIVVFGQTDSVSIKKNILKINLTALVFKNISVQYERKLGKRTSVAVNVHTIPFGKLPFSSKIQDAIDDASVQFDLFKLGSFGVTPELRYYVGKHGSMRGFYLGAMANITSYKMDLPINYSDKTGVFNGKVNTTTFGLQLGAQYKLGKSIYLDWWILGPSIGTGKGNLNLVTTLTPDEQDDLRSELEDVKNDDVLKHVVDDYSVNGNGANIHVKGPWAGIRAFGINLGFVF